MKTAKLRNSSKEIPVGKIVCVGRNYYEHIKELNNEVPKKPLLFLKPASSIVYNGESIIRPAYAESMQFEVELLLLIGKTIKDASLAEAKDAIIGYGVGIDATLRELQNKLKEKGHPWTTAKCFDTSAAISDFISAADYSLTLDEEISLTQNGIVRQKELLNKMIFSPVELIQYVSSMITLEEGDIVFTGTPAGVGNMEAGDSITALIDGVARLDVKVGC